MSLETALTQAAFFPAMQHRTNMQLFAAYPLAPLAAAFVLGILGALLFGIPLPLVVSIAVLTTLLAVIALLGRKMKLAKVFVILTMLFLGSSLSAIEKTRVPANQLKRLIDQGAIAVGEPVEITGVLQSDPEAAPERLYLNLRVI